MVKSHIKLLLMMFVLVLAVLLGLNFVIADGNICNNYGGTALSEAECRTVGCVWTTNTSTTRLLTDPLTETVWDPWCTSSIGCCLPKQCWLFNGLNGSACVNNTVELDCSWDAYSTIGMPNGTNLIGGCWMDYAGNSSNWGGMSDGCWNYDADKSECQSSANSAKCEWKPNDANQNPWCGIKTIFDAQQKNSAAISEDIGCCDMKGCWNYDGNETQCVNNTAFNGLCEWVSKANDPWCNNDIGCCRAKWCNQVNGEANCTNLKQNLMMPCEYVGGNCQEMAGGGFFFFNDTNSCFDKGGWWNASGDCVLPIGDFMGGGGGFMFAEEAHCWFADNQPSVCRNITGCIYCNATGTHWNVTGNSGTANMSSACYNAQIGYCQGHQPTWTNPGASNPVSDIYSGNLNCTHIKIRSACEYGPLPNCKWTNTSTIIGAFCDIGTSSNQKLAPPVGFCEHPDAINNYTLCSDLASVYMMPCKWGNVSSNKTVSDNCTFNPSAVFGGSGSAGMENEYEIITSEYSCIAAGGTWHTELYLEGGMLKQEKWCDKGAMFNLNTQTAYANKGNCDADCWACEFNASGGNFGGNATIAWQTCNNSKLGYCVWATDTNAPNQLGWCDYPKEMSYGAGDCQDKCKDCGLMQNPYDSCMNSAAQCKWINNTVSSTDQAKLATGECVSQNKKTCDDDCFSCYDFSSCNGTAVNCQWDNTDNFCKPYSFDGEICFDGVDNDGDSMMDCADPDCSFDMACGGSAFGDCSKYSYDGFFYNSISDAVANCTNATAFGSMNCTWINFTWEDIGHCGMPGEDCWQYDNNMTLCGLTTGCTNTTTMTFSNFCMINMTKEEGFNCWQYNDESSCGGAASGSSSATQNCTWVTSEWGGDNGGWCEYWLFAQCHNYKSDKTGCNADANCSWNTWGEGEGMCDVACFNQSLDSTSCIAGDLANLCEWKDASNNVCMPSTFEAMGGGGSGAKTGCAQYDGNFSACTLKNFTCIWFNDSSIDNNVSSEANEIIDGWCNSKGEYKLSGEMKGELFFLGSDIPDSSPDLIDIQGFGMKVTDNAYGFGIKVMNITDAALCNSYQITLGSYGAGAGGTTIGTGLETTKFFWYLDTNDNSTGRCSGYYENESAIAGFEFYISYIVKNNTNTGNIETSKQMFRCVQNSSSDWSWSSTNTFISDNKKFTCFESGGAAFVTIEKESLENFNEFNMTVPLRVFATTANATYNRTSPQDSVGPGYYTPGTIDFAFVDCSNPDIKDPQCKNFQKFGFNSFEDCKNGVDDDSDGLTDCNDAKCVFSPVCASGTAFDFTSGTNDNKAPVVMFTKVDKMDNEAIIIFDTDEASNGTLYFYNKTANCPGASLNKTLVDVGSDDFSNDDYKPFHRITLDSVNLGYALVNGTTYYYKVKVCDPFNNCGTSMCLNFTTRNSAKNFIFRMDLPDGYTVDIPALNYSGNFTYTNTSTLGAGVVKNIGIKTNTTETKGMNITVNKSDLSIKFVGADVYKPKVLDLDGAFIMDTTNEYLGMNATSKSWNLLISDLGLGGPGDYIELNFPVAYSSSNVLNWSNDAITIGNDVTTYVNCSDGGNSNTLCKIPTSLGFSVYTISVPATAGDTTTAGGGGGGGGTPTNATTVKSDDETEGDGTVIKDEGEALLSPPDEGIEDGEKEEFNWLWVVIGIVVVVLVGVGYWLFRGRSSDASLKSSNVKK